MNTIYPPLPDYEPRPDLWARIESDLTNEQLLSRAITELPDHQPASDAWLAIEQALDQPSLVQKRSLIGAVSRPVVWAGLAAAVVVLVSVWLYLRPTSLEKVRIEYAVESPTHQAREHASTLGFTNQSAEAFIAQTCAQQQLVCQQPEVHELRNQLVDLTNEWARIERERQVFGDDPRLIQAQTKVENQRTQITKELITILRS